MCKGLLGVCADWCGICLGALVSIIIPTPSMNEWVWKFQPQGGWPCVEQSVWPALGHSVGVVGRAEGDPGGFCAPNNIFRKKVSTRRSTCSQALEYSRPNGLGYSSSAVETHSYLISGTENPEMWRWLKFTAFLTILATTAFLFLTCVFQNPHSPFLACFIAVPLPVFP